MGPMKEERALEKSNINKSLKFDKLRKIQRPASSKLKNFVVNLPNTELDKNTNEILQKGLNFALAPSRIPQPYNNAEDIRQECALVLKDAKPSKKNITKEEFAALKKLKGGKDIMVLKANKGNTTIFIKTEDYQQLRIINRK